MFSNFNQPVDLYCERLSPAFWAEPVNAISNLAFLLAALFAYLVYRKYHVKSRSIISLIIMTVIVGLGSFTFHTFATEGAMLADVIPIEVFIIYALITSFIQVFRLKWFQAVFCIIAFLAFNALILNIFGRGFLNGSIQYIPTFLILLFISLYSQIKHYPPAKEFALAAVVFLVSLTFRSIDRNICPQLPIGTHFLWHILNGVTMYYVIKGLIINHSNKAPSLS